VVYRDLTTGELAVALESVGLPPATAAFVASLDEAIARGELEVSDADLVRLLGRPVTTLAEGISAAKA
jgi:NAD(P)H dehydrogenase (quinone)